MSRAEQAATIRRVYPRVLSKVLSFARSLPDAEDAVHDAVERALNSWGDSGAPDSAEAWLITVAHNAHRDRLRRSRRPFQTEAAIAAVHCQAPRAIDTNWSEIATLYGLLEGYRPTPAVRVNRAFAVGKAQGPEAGLLLLLSRTDIDASSYRYFHLVRGALLQELGQVEAAAASLTEACEHTRNDEERRQIEHRLAQLTHR